MGYYRALKLLARQSPQVEQNLMIFQKQNVSCEQVAIQAEL